MTLAMSPKWLVVVCEILKPWSVMLRGKYGAVESHDEADIIFGRTFPGEVPRDGYFFPCARVSLALL